MLDIIGRKIKFSVEFREDRLGHVIGFDTLFGRPYLKVNGYVRYPHYSIEEYEFESIIDSSALIEVIS